MGWVLNLVAPTRRIVSAKWQLRSKTRLNLSGCRTDLCEWRHSLRPGKNYIPVVLALELIKKILETNKKFQDHDSKSRPLGDLKILKFKFRRNPTLNLDFLKEIS